MAEQYSNWEAGFEDLVSKINEIISHAGNVYETLNQIKKRIKNYNDREVFPLLADYIAGSAERLGVDLCCGAEEVREQLDVLSVVSGIGIQISSISGSIGAVSLGETINTANTTLDGLNVDTTLITQMARVLVFLVSANEDVVEEIVKKMEE